MHVDAAGAGGVDDAEKAIGLAPAVGPAELHVGDLHMDAAMLADVDRFGDGLVHGMGFVADVGGVACAVGFQHATQGAQSSRSLKLPGAVNRPDDRPSAPASSPSSSMSCMWRSSGDEGRGNGGRSLAAGLAPLVMRRAPLLVAEPPLLLDDLEPPRHGRERRRLAAPGLTDRRQPQHQRLVPDILANYRAEIERERGPRLPPRCQLLGRPHHPYRILAWYLHP